MSGWALKHHPTPLSGGDRKALMKARAMANILAAQSAEMRAKGEAMIQQADIGTLPTCRACQARSTLGGKAEVTRADGDSWF